VTKNESSVAVIGAGNWGGSLLAALKGAGIAVSEVVVKDWRQAKLDARAIWICVPDAAIAEVTEKIVERRGSLRGQIVVHSSGALSARVLEAARRAGARIAAVHPVMSFPTRRVVPLEGVMFGIEAHEAAVRRELYGLVRRFGGIPFAVKAETKALYHAAGTFASPLLVSALVAAMETAELAGLDKKTAERWVRALAEATVTNVFTRGAKRSFSGPFARGDAETIRLHLQALEAHPILADVYRALARYAIAELPVKNRPALQGAVAAIKIK
jgi:predicted short-subunit dehydrogenase-like oxidoreductase (DUF2520 family)